MARLAAALVANVLLLQCALMEATPVSADAPTPADVERAHTQVPRDHFKGHGPAGLGEVLNGHLRNSESVVRACEYWSAEELQAFMARLHNDRSPELQGVYQTVGDRRRLHLTTTAEYETHWSELSAIARAHPHLHDPLRDAHCREAVMWWTHHLTEERREEHRGTNATIPLMPAGDRRACVHDGHPEKQQLCKAIERPNTCDWCHSTQKDHDAGVNGTSPPDALQFTDGPDDGNPHEWDRQRRCDQDEMPRCQLCEGVGGRAYGDKNEDIDLVDCEIVGTPEQVGCTDNSGTVESCNGTNVHWPLYPKKFTMEKVDGRPGYVDTLIGQKRDRFCFSFFPGKDSIGDLCYRSQDATGKWYDIEKEAARTDYNVKLTGLFSHFPNITSSVLHGGWQMWIVNHLWLVDQCVCTSPSGNHCDNPPCRSYIWRWDTFRTAQYLGRERVGVEWLKGAGVGKDAKMWELDHFIMWAHHAWTDPKTGKIVRMWKSFNGLQNYDPDAWRLDVDEGVLDGPPAKCKKGGARIRIHCDDNGNYDGETVEGAHHLAALEHAALDARTEVTLPELKSYYMRARDAEREAGGR